MAERGGLEHMEPGLRLVRAPNASPMTYTGTNTWIVGQGAVAVIDPGPEDEGHLATLLDGLDPGETVHAIAVTHAHRDHSPLARRLSEVTGAPICAAGNMAGRRRPIMAKLATEGLVGGGEGVDHTFAPDHPLENGDVVEGPGWRLSVISSPGHTADHLCFGWEDAVFSGDHVMGWASSLVSPPDGDLVSFLASCATLRERPARVYYPGHGEPVSDPMGRIDWLVGHRNTRTDQILSALKTRPATPAELTREIYTDVDPALLPAAERNVLAHLIALFEDNRIRSTGPLGADATFALT